MQIGINQYLDLEDPGRSINHSCNPNSGIRGNIFLVALRDIYPKEEIRFDYSTCIEEDSWTMRCRCKSSNCRKTIGDFSRLPEDLRKKYLHMNIVQEFIAERYK